MSERPYLDALDDRGVQGVREDLEMDGHDGHDEKAVLLDVAPDDQELLDVGLDDLGLLDVVQGGLRHCCAVQDDLGGQGELGNQ